MKFLVTVSAIAAFVAAAIALIINRFYKIAFERSKEEKTPDAASLGVPWSAYVDEIKEGAEWIESNITDRVSVSSYDGLRLCAAVIRHPDAVGTAVMFHGYRSFPLVDFGGAVSFYHSLGLNIILVDERAHGESEGDTITFGLKERFDVNTWAYFAQNYFPDLPVLLAGVSMGASTVLFSALTDLPACVKGIIADCGYLSPWAELTYILKRDYHLPPFPIMYMMNMIFKHKTGCDLREVSTVEAVKSTDIPIMFIHGGADRFVPTDFTVEAYEACSSPKQLLIVKQAAHATSYLADKPEYERTVSKFIGKIIKSEGC